MPAISMWAIRLACVYLGVGLTAGALMLADKGIAFLPHARSWLPLHLHVMLFGWTVQMIIGVGYWVLPKFRGGSSRGNDALAVVALVLVNVGVLAGCVEPLLGATAALAFGLQIAAALTFALHVWPRIKRFGEH